LGGDVKPGKEDEEENTTREEGRETRRGGKNCLTSSQTSGESNLSIQRGQAGADKRGRKTLGGGRGGVAWKSENKNRYVFKNPRSRARQSRECPFHQKTLRQYCVDSTLPSFKICGRRKKRKWGATSFKQEKAKKKKYWHRDLKQI